MSRGLPQVAEKPRFVAEMFSRIATRYDVMNTLMTGGRDRAWRRVAAAEAHGRRVLDVGTGTGKLAVAILERSPETCVIGIDFSLEMLRAGRRRSLLAQADALRLPFADASFDAVTSAFLVRNLADIQQGIAEQLRVLRPGGRLVILETTPGPRGAIRIFFELYFRGLVPLLGRLVAGDPSAYTYLPESTLAFLDPPRLAQLLCDAGLQDVRSRILALGSVAVTVGRRPYVMLRKE